MRTQTSQIAFQAASNHTDNHPPTAASNGSVHGSRNSSVLWAGDVELTVKRRADIPGAALSTYVTAPRAEPQTRA